jgi:hypothetical protein
MVKNILQTILFITVLMSSVLAQSSETLKVSLDQENDANKPVIFTVKVETSAEIGNAVFIEFPAGLKPVLRSAKLGNKQLWLLNSKQEITKDNVIGWYTKDDGLILHYTDSITENSDSLEIELVPDQKRLQRFEKVDVKMYPVSKSGQDLNIQKAVLSQSNVSVKKVDNE